jgi:hypothetical protein
MQSIEMDSQNFFQYFRINKSNFTLYEPGSSVSIVSDYGLDDRAIEVRSPAEAKAFFL